jgi:hypothetical protein
MDELRNIAQCVFGKDFVSHAYFDVVSLLSNPILVSNDVDQLVWKWAIMILSDNETKVDLLNNEAIAKTIVMLLRERPEHPITIGVHGDWGCRKIERTGDD